MGVACDKELVLRRPTKRAERVTNGVSNRCGEQETQTLTRRATLSSLFVQRVSKRQRPRGPSLHGMALHDKRWREAFRFNGVVHDPF